ncbi:MAG: ATP synthase F1 subunit epsilon [Candidatus Krumholzibacteria bacterium]|nr:ATP synthase F1 subunit epsilon [Candidatus Krumholzibacteria bacterium]MDH4337457.1 ATP synthase F1 subunit epsilon [Candidatus Krumholzibacteria bacterium]MDH5270163.1 ATP synthase F1 subunit epsilon [Candidatus Krumholzibacteria bacterium]MDH5628464.1 ATP synthase F1 subunit epsilon [Candidatus Krumholzibacteria bacterium]
MVTQPKFSFKVLTPNRKAFDGDVVSIVAPGGAGYLGVLANHAPLITTVQTGELTVKLPDNRVSHYTVGRGLLKVANNQVVLLTESVEETKG